MLLFIEFIECEFECLNKNLNLNVCVCVFCMSESNGQVLDLTKLKLASRV